MVPFVLFVNYFKYILFIYVYCIESVTFFSTALISETILNLSGINLKSKLPGPTPYMELISVIS